MSTQTELFPILAPDYPKEASTEEKFWEFHRLNPHVYKAIVAEARHALDNNYKVGINAICEHLRWHWRARTRGDDYKLNNNWHPYYARLVMKRIPELDGFFELREQTSCR